MHSAIVRSGQELGIAALELWQKELWGGTVAVGRLDRELVVVLDVRLSGKIGLLARAAGL